ncbi:Malonyl CoA-acyl carrier protein transacylase [Paraburkholderia domus]|jgi:malonate decarboxylase, epsilon subunit|uniref:Malonyl CoA-acyl carrier protein transacylase n=1 Tax=Paraburkholderia domus TaxID=2793075 RepID=A0A9N8N605_9BURK|nr:malonate decarboxylase subunit epsilon [Paraburkholderia domus]MBK5053431.1 malonate decarboxylase subunit epsilon [Burkholderia sp. R-70006]MBK5065289.1 malonate decarboxylase subunit epsilon [Burkholderia sp. R-70199]MBK5090407.1 malonate decarboxylase subunit epsilon [Burkholderia sp. R-69927]MBK5125210.1 malonate decarboxylase subunit epsilon [Burkholderia sp. R-69980]MBK5169329.1 malonate decarboxylase subunit epsilon [Burkholderia sp. R-70211]MBK5184594.1 malonate decarboxylase subun
MFALLFPGQGAQSDGFLHRLPQHHAVTDTLEEASQVLDIDVLSLDTPNALRSTVAVQIGLTVAGVAITRALADEYLTPEISAGLSVGAYAAAVSCGAIRFGDALKMVRKRAELMETAYPSGYSLAAVSGLTEHQLETLATQHEDAGNQRVYIGNVNAPRQIVMAGENGTLDRFIERALAAGARKAIRLAVSVPSHCELLAHAADELVAYAQDVPFYTPQSTYIGNRGGRPLYTADAIRDDLSTNMRYTVRWFDALTVMQEMGARVLIEAPPGQVLTDIARENFPDTTALAASTFTFERLVATTQRRLEAN